MNTVRPIRFILPFILLTTTVVQCAAGQEAYENVKGTYGRWSFECSKACFHVRHFNGFIINQKGAQVTLYYEYSNLFTDFSSFMTGRINGNIIHATEVVLYINPDKGYQVEKRSCKRVFNIRAGTINYSAQASDNVDAACNSDAASTDYGLASTVEQRLTSSILAPLDADEIYKGKTWRDCISVPSVCSR